MHTAAIFLDVEYRETSREVKQNSWVAKTDWDMHVDKNKTGSRRAIIRLPILSKALKWEK